jgi:hypothetical protein
MPDVHRLTQQPGFADLAAVKSGQTYVIDHGLFSRPGPRLWDGLELLAELLYGGCSSSSSRDDRRERAQQQQPQPQQQQQQEEEPTVLKLLDLSEEGAVSWGPVRMQPLQ